jgi:hypothetical protein
MKSREEILTECHKTYLDKCGYTERQVDSLTYNYISRLPASIHQAMTEYADQFAVEFAEWVVETLLTGNISMHGKPTTDLLTIFKKERGIEW